MARLVHGGVRPALSCMSTLFLSPSAQSISALQQQKSLTMARPLNSSMATSNSRRSASTHYGAVVAGAGPAGLAVVGNLLEQDVSGGVIWVDPNFESGRLGSNWREVPSNTKVQLFLDYARALAPFRKVIDSFADARKAIQTLENLDQNKGCSISNAADMCQGLTDGLLKAGEVDSKFGRVSGASWNSKTASWTVEINNNDTNTPASDGHSNSNGNVASTLAPKTTTIATSRLVLCIGAQPRGIPLAVPSLEIQKISLDIALAPTKLQQLLPDSSSSSNSTPLTIGVVGASHSAILVLLNLYHLATTTHPHLKIKWFTRSELRYAVQKKDYILYDNTGLKGQAADFARENLEDSKLPSSPVSEFLEKIDCSASEQAQYDTHLPACSHIVQATGFVTNAMPMLSRDGHVLDGVRFDSRSGVFRDQKGKQVQGLFGAGIAFPETITDPEGNVEASVGLWKFMRFLKRVVGDEWLLRR